MTQETKTIIEELTINDKNIDDYAFYNQRIKKITLNEGVETIGDKAFYNNKADNVKLPNSIKKIGYFSFNQTSITYLNHTISGFIINQYDDFINIAKHIFKIIPSFDFNKTSPSIVKNIYNNTEYLKAYYYNLKKFQKLIEICKQNFKITYINDYIIFKFCIITGFFTKNMDNIFNFICEYAKQNSINDIFIMTDNIEQLHYYPNLAQILIKNYDNELFKKIFVDYYNNYKKINKIIEKRKSELTRKNIINRKYGREYEMIGKKITIKDIINYYIKRLKVSEDCKELTEIVPILSSYVDKNEYIEIENIYRLSKLVQNKNQCFTFVEGKGEIFSYKWLKGDDIINFIAGYLCDSCARQTDIGNDIVTESMTNPNIKTMVISLDERIIAKTTAYYNPEYEYLIFNTISVNKEYYKKARKQIRMTLLKDILVGINKQIELMEKQGYNVKSIRVGTEFNNLINEIKSLGLEITTDILDNFNFESNNAKDNQAILKKSKN